MVRLWAWFKGDYGKKWSHIFKQTFTTGKMIISWNTWGSIRKLMKLTTYKINLKTVEYFLPIGNNFKLSKILRSRTYKTLKFKPITWSISTGRVWYMETGTEEVSCFILEKNYIYYKKIFIDVKWTSITINFLHLIKKELIVVQEIILKFFT